MRRRKRDSHGQAAMVDAILFMTVMLLASAVVLGWSSRQDSDQHQMQQYSRDFAQTLLATELSDMCYTDTGGRQVNLSGQGRSIGRLLCDEAVILSSSSGGCGFTGYEARILAAGRALARPGLDFAVSCNDDLVFISGSVANTSGLPPQRWASQVTVLSGDSCGLPVIITVYVWVV